MTRSLSVRTVASAVCLLVLGLSTAEARAQAADTVWTPELSMQYFAIGGTAMSPDGELVAYVVRAPLMEGEQSAYRSHIYLASAGGIMNARVRGGAHGS
jgi:hypothetical protein